MRSQRALNRRSWRREPELVPQIEGMSGLELQYVLSSEGRSVPIVFVTAMDDPTSRRRALEAGAAAYLEKPFDEQRLLEVLQQVTAHRAN